jgi:hypothetical protein
MKFVFRLFNFIKNYTKNADQSGHVTSDSSNPKYQVLITVRVMYVQMGKTTKSEMEENPRECRLYNAMGQKNCSQRRKDDHRQRPNITVNRIAVRRQIQNDNLR